MIYNKVYLGDGTIVISDVTETGMIMIRKWASCLNCQMDILKDDGSYYTVEIASSQKNLYYILWVLFGTFYGRIR